MVKSYLYMYTKPRSTAGFHPEFFGGGGGKNMCIEPRPLVGCGVMLPQEILEIYML